MNYNINRKYKMCTRCVMDTSDIEIIFDEDGVCNYCLEAERELPKYQFSTEEEKMNLDQIKKKLLHFLLWKILML